MLSNLEQKPRLSIIVPVYNVERYLPKCIESILAQTFQNYELILINDGSTDNGGSICDEYAERDNRIRVIHQTNSGLSVVRNIGLENAIGEYVAFVDSDDWIEPDTYESVFDFLISNDLKIVCFDFYVEHTNRKYCRPLYDSEKLFMGKEAVNEILRERIDNAVWDKVYRRSLFEGIKYPAGKFFEDVATTYKVLAKSDRTGYLNKPLYHYIKRQNSITGSSFHSKKRWDRFLAHLERIKFAENNDLPVVEECYAHATREALSAMTANYTDNALTEEEARTISRFINENKDKFNAGMLKGKIRIFLFFQDKMPVFHKMYSRLSYLFKKSKIMRRLHFEK